MRPLLGGRYRLVSLEPDVGLFETWKARDPEAGDGVVRLELLPYPAGGADFDALVQRLRSLSDVGLPTVLDGGRDERAAWVVSEHTEGRSLSHWLGGHRAAGTAPSFGAAQRLFEKLGAAVRFAHEARGIDAHGGLCARNVLVRRMGAQHAVKVLGLGLASQVSDDAGSLAWARLWPYLAPERLASTATATRPGDVFALAVLFVEMLTAHATPGVGNDTWGALSQSPDGRLRDRLVALRDDVPGAVWDVIVRAMSPAPRDRPASAALLLRTLREAWTAAGRWEAPPTNEREPPDPSPEDMEAARPLAPPRRASSDGGAPLGWQPAERAAVTPSIPASPVAVPDEVAAPDEIAAPAPARRPQTVMLDEASRSAFLDPTTRPSDDATHAIMVPVAPGDDAGDPTEAIDIPPEDDEDAVTYAQQRPQEVLAAVSSTLALHETSPFVQSSSRSEGARAVDRTIAPGGVARDDEFKTEKVVLSEEIKTEKVLVDEEVKAARALGEARKTERVSHDVIVKAVQSSATRPRPSTPAPKPRGGAPRESFPGSTSRVIVAPSVSVPSPTPAPAPTRAPVSVPAARPSPPRWPTLAAVVALLVLLALGVYALATRQSAPATTATLPFTAPR